MRYLRAIYLSFVRARTPEEWIAHEATFTALTPLQQNASLIESAYRAKHAYFSFVEALNQFGRQLQKLGLEVPLYRRIRFFRNKVVEHWDDYLAMRPGNGAIGKHGEIMAPTIIGLSRIELAKMEPACSALISQFAAHGVGLDVHVDDWYEAYADRVWLALEVIDPKLNSETSMRRKTQQQFVPDTLVNPLFDYEFPLPFYDVDAYCADLVASLRAHV